MTTTTSIDREIDPTPTQSEPPVLATPVGAKRPFAAIRHSPETGNRRKDPKVSRACDTCKGKKIRCNGVFPCCNCTRRNVSCTYSAKYGRGRPPTPPSSTRIPNQEGTPVPRQSPPEAREGYFTNEAQEVIHHVPNEILARATPSATANFPSRASPELEIEGQYFDPTSGVSFLHRAWRKLFTQPRGTAASDGLNEVDRDKNQSLTSAGDRPFQVDNNSSNSGFIPEPATARRLLSFYFDTCVVTYRMLHRQTTEAWMDVFLKDREQNKPIGHSLSRAKCAILLTILAIATLRDDKINGTVGETMTFPRSDQLFCTAMNLTDNEIGFPRLESAQARLIQVLYLLQTSRMNKGWYTFGNLFQITLSLGMHRKRDKKANAPVESRRTNYVTTQCHKRTFWVAYVIDKYLSVVFGRPRLYQDEDIDQDFPDSVNDEDMTTQGPSYSEDVGDCHIDSLILHAKIARIIGRISREVYSVGDMPHPERVAAAHRLGRELHEWHANLPPHLGTVKPSTLIPTFRRQAIALQLAYFHAVIHANRPFILGDENGANVGECIEAATSCLELVDKIASDSTLFHSFWWMHYVTFCALVVVYVWEIQNGRRTLYQNDRSYMKLLDLAERCRSHLRRATTGPSPSRRYNIILEELRHEAQNRQVMGNTNDVCYQTTQYVGDGAGTNLSVPFVNSSEIPISAGAGFVPLDDGTMPNTWQISDWLDLDSSAFFPFLDTNSVSPPFLSTDSA